MNAIRVLAYLQTAIASFAGDPPDSAFQRGYLAALEAVHEDCFMTETERRAARARKGRRRSPSQASD